MKRKKRRRIRIKPRFVRLVLLVVMAVSLIALCITLAKYLQSRASYARAQTLAVSTPAPTALVTPAPEAAPSPTPAETPPISVDFDALRAEGEHVRGWLYSAGTVINYPVVYCSDNSYYLTHDYTGKPSSAGALFIDARAGEELAGDNLIIYGHRMKDGSMFKRLLQYRKQAYYDEHPTMYLLTPDGNYRIDIFAARHAEAEAEQFPLFFESADAKRAFVEEAMAETHFTPADTAYRPDARIVTLVTCSYSDYMDDVRYQVLGWLTPIG